MHNTHGWRVLEERNDYRISYNQFGQVNCWNKLIFAQILRLLDKKSGVEYFEELTFNSSNVPLTGKEEEKYLKRSMKKILKRMKGDKNE